jgi:hypothetical protein
MEDEDEIFVDSILASRIIDALKLRGLSVQSVEVHLRPNTVVSATVQISLTQQQMRMLLEGLATPPEDRR